MATLRKQRTKNGYVYAVDFTVDGKRHIISTKTNNVRVAKQILGEIQGKIARGTFNLNEKKKKEITLLKFTEKYLQFALTYKGKSTIALEKHYLAKLKKVIGDRNIRSISSDDLDEWKMDLAAKVSPTTVNIERRALHAVFNVAKRWGYIESNPFASVTKLKVQEKRLFMTEEEISTLFAEINNDVAQSKNRRRRRIHELFRLYVDFLLNTGLRRNEALSLQPQDIDFTHGVIYINKTKNKEMRIIPLNRRAKEILQELGGNIFGELNNALVTQKFLKLTNRLEMFDFKLHSLRHTFACRLIARGVDIYTVSKLLGHSDLKTTMVYAKVDLSSMQNAVNKLPHQPPTDILPPHE